MCRYKNNLLIYIVTNMDYCENCENVTIYDDFFEQIDKSIITGDVVYIQNALKMYGNQLPEESVKMAARVIFQIIEEKIEDISLS